MSGFISSCDTLWSCVLQDYEEDEQKEWTLCDRITIRRMAFEEARKERKELQRQKAMARRRKNSSGFFS